MFRPAGRPGSAPGPHRHGGRRGLLRACLTLLLLSGAPSCSPCWDWSDLDVELIGIEDTPQNRASFRAGLDHFITWTGRPETCVHRVELYDDLPDGEHGSYHSRERIVKVRGDTLPRTTTHEFCHALDHEEGWISELGADILFEYAPHRTPREAFARICEQGPELPALIEELNHLCWVDESLEALRFVADVAFQGEPPANLLLHEHAGRTRFTVKTTTTTVRGSERTGVPVGAIAAKGSEGLFVLDHAGEADDHGEFMIAPLLMLVDPLSSTVLDTLALAPHPIHDVGGVPFYQMQTLIGSTDDPILLSSLGEDRGMAWRIITEPLRLEAMPRVPLGEGSIPIGFENEGSLILRSSPDEPLILMHLRTGTMIRIGDEQAECIEPDGVRALYADESGGVAACLSPGGMTLAGIDWSGDLSWTRDMMVKTDDVRSLFRTPDYGILLTPVVTPPPLADLPNQFAVSLLYDPGDSVWSTPHEGCVGLEGTNWLLHGGENWSIKQPMPGDGDYSLQLRRLETGETSYPRAP